MDEEGEDYSRPSRSARKRAAEHLIEAHEIAVRLGHQGKDVVLEIEDDGIAFDPTEGEPPPLATLESTRIGGWGMRIVRRFSDEVRYRRIDGRNCLTLIFRQPSQAGT